ncbi:UNVERIFIED_CONTAM: hypothetical protein KB574_09425 [Streptococcus canis]
MAICRTRFAKQLYKLAEELVEDGMPPLDDDDDDELFFFECKIERLCQAVLDELIAVETNSGKKLLTLPSGMPHIASGVNREIWFDMEREVADDTEV